MWTPKTPGLALLTLSCWDISEGITKTCWDV